MKKLLAILIIVFPLRIAFSQDQKMYTTTSYEWIFSSASLQKNSDNEGIEVRFAPVYNIQNWLHYDAGRRVGFFTGFAIRNVGFIYNVPDSGIKKKYRSYNFSVPLGIKVGNLRKLSLFAGYELEIPFNYKEKTFVNERKTDKYSVWFSTRTPALMHSLMIGLQLPKGTAIKFKYYLNGFFNPNYAETFGKSEINKPYEEFNANIMYLSVNFNLFQDFRFRKTKKVTGPVKEVSNYMLSDSEGSM